jgi:molecular chaperone GrpE
MAFSGQADGAPGEPREEGDEGSPAAQVDIDEQKEKYLRLAAEYENFRKRTQRERMEERSRSQGDLVKQLVDGLDDLSRVAHHDPGTIDVPTLMHGAEIAERKLLKALQNAGLVIVYPIDQAFDPALHEAVGTEAALSPEDDHVVARVYQPGYLFNSQLLRPARVVVKQWNG